ncbi:MAG: molybdopterin-binding protein [Candidatus Hodarchaeales archaeon]
MISRRDNSGKKLRVQLISIGDEILIGNTVDTNSNYLAGRLTRLGAVITRIVTIPDDTNTIVKELNESVKNHEFVVTTGGLGPTWDDGTVIALAEFLGAQLKLNKEAFEMIKATYKRLHAEGKLDSPDITAERKKMAILPDHDSLSLIPNPVGVAPGIHIAKKDSDLFVLPGVPKEMKAMVPFIERIVSRRSGLYYHELLIDAPISAESTLAPYIRRVREKYPECYVKSTPSAHSRNAIPVIVTAAEEDEDKAIKLVENAAAFLLEIIREKPGKDLLQNEL